jgi:cell shape-determining protein MreD
MMGTTIFAALSLLVATLFRVDHTGPVWAQALFVAIAMWMLACGRWLRRRKTHENNTVPNHPQPVDGH